MNEERIEVKRMAGDRFFKVPAEKWLFDFDRATSRVADAGGLAFMTFPHTEQTELLKGLVTDIALWVKKMNDRGGMASEEAWEMFPNAMNAAIKMVEDAGQVPIDGND